MRSILRGLNCKRLWVEERRSWPAPVRFFFGFLPVIRIKGKALVEQFFKRFGLNLVVVGVHFRQKFLGVNGETVTVEAGVTGAHQAFCPDNGVEKDVALGGFNGVKVVHFYVIASRFSFGNDFFCPFNVQVIMVFEGIDQVGLRRVANVKFFGLRNQNDINLPSFLLVVNGIFAMSHAVLQSIKGVKSGIGWGFGAEPQS